MFQVSLSQLQPAFHWKHGKLVMPLSRLSLVVVALFVITDIYLYFLHSSEGACRGAVVCACIACSYNYIVQLRYLQCKYTPMSIFEV
jgi:hypothetical protein